MYTFDQTLLTDFEVVFAEKSDCNILFGSKQNLMLKKFHQN